MEASGSPALLHLRRAGAIASAVREACVSRMAAGASVLDLCAFVESEIAARGGEPAFPAQISCNAVAAHDSPAPDDVRTLLAGDLVKLDLGVHVDGYVVDTAVSHVIDGPGAERRRAVVGAAQAGLEAALAALQPGMLVRDLAEVVERTIRAAGFRPVRGLSGHGVGRWRVHCPPPIPNLVDETDPQARIEVDMVVAIEVFATTGAGLVEPRGHARVFSASPTVAWTLGDPDAERIVRRLRGLPFAPRQLGQLGMARVELALRSLRRFGALRAYPPLVESSGGDVSQAEHTVIVGETGTTNLTARPNPADLRDPHDPPGRS